MRQQLKKLENYTQFQSSFSEERQGSIQQMRAVYRTPADLRWLSWAICLQRGPHLDCRLLPGGASGYEQYWLPPTATSPDSLLWKQPVVQGLDSVSQPQATVRLTFSDDLLSNLLWVSRSPKFLIKETLQTDIFHVTENQSFHILPIKYYAAIWNAAVLFPEQKKKFTLAH